MTYILVTSDQTIVAIVLDLYTHTVYESSDIKIIVVITFGTLTRVHLTTSEQRHHSLACKRTPIEHSHSENNRKPQAVSTIVVLAYKALVI